MIILPAGHEHDFQVKWEHPDVGESEERGKQPQHRLTLTDKLRPGGEKANKVCVCWCSTPFVNISEVFIALARQAKICCNISDPLGRLAPNYTSLQCIAVYHTAEQKRKH